MAEKHYIIGKREVFVADGPNYYVYDMMGEVKQIWPNKKRTAKPPKS